MGLLSIYYVFKNLQLPILLHSFSPDQFLEPFPSPSPFLTFFSPPSHPRFHKPYPQSKTFINIRSVPSSAVFCSNAMLLTTSSSSMLFFSFFEVLPSAPTNTEMISMLLIFYILLIYLFSSCYLSFFFFRFSCFRSIPSENTEKLCFQGVNINQKWVNLKITFR